MLANLGFPARVQPGRAGRAVETGAYYGNRPLAKCCSCLSLDSEMIVDFQHHYTPPELMEGHTGAVRLDEDGNPNYRFNALLSDLPAHVRMMDRAGIDVSVLSCGTG